MTTVEEWTDPYIPTYRRVPAVGPGVCRVCHGGPNPGYDVCLSCSRTTGQVSRPADLVVPISVCEEYGQFHTVLRQYKDGAVEQTRTRFRLQLSALTARFLREHRACMTAATGADFDLVTVVPSSANRPGDHPLWQIIDWVGALRGLAVPTLARGSGPLGWNAASDNGYVVTADVRGRHVLVVEDTFTSGARSQSASSALALAGAASVRVLVAGRYMNRWNEACKAILDTGASEPFSFQECCLATH